MADAPDPLDAQRHVWTIGDYPTMARRLLPVALTTVEAAGVRAGQDVLDVGVGDGNAAIAAARLGATVTGIDLTPAQIEHARRRCADEGVDVHLRVGDAQALDVPDAAFDVVLSVLALIFAPDHHRALAEAVRACRPGGTVAIASWAEGGWMLRWREAAASLVPPGAGPTPGPDQWGEPDEVRRRFAAVGLDAEVTRHELHWSFASADEAADLYLRASGPFITFMTAMEGMGRADEARAVLVQALDEANSAADGGFRLTSPYLVAVATRP